MTARARTADLAPLLEPRRLPAASRIGLALEIATMYARARRALRRKGVRGALEELRSQAERVSAAPGEGGAYAGGLRLGRAVALVLRPLPGDTRCLTMSLVLCGLLARRGLRGAVVIGVRPGEALGAHAWVELDGRPLLAAHAGEFERLVEL